MLTALSKISTTQQQGAGGKRDTLIEVRQGGWGWERLLGWTQTADGTIWSGLVVWRHELGIAKSSSPMSRGRCDGVKKQ